MPFQDPTIEASWQVFVSTYFLEHLSTTFLA